MATWDDGGEAGRIRRVEPLACEESGKRPEDVRNIGSLLLHDPPGRAVDDRRPMQPLLAEHERRDDLRPAAGNVGDVDLLQRMDLVARTHRVAPTGGIGQCHSERCAHFSRVRIWSTWFSWDETRDDRAERRIRRLLPARAHCYDDQRCSRHGCTEKRCACSHDSLPTAPLGQPGKGLQAAELPAIRANFRACCVDPREEPLAPRSDLLMQLKL